jgi:uncharacterized protein YndB with AHSA1/START domain
MSGEVVVRRFMAIPREEVFAAWLDAEMLAAFMKPGNVSAATAEVDARVGGRFRIVMVHGGRDHPHWGEYLKIDPPSLLSFTWHSAATNEQPTVVTVEFIARDGGTEVVLTHRRLPKEKAEEHRQGWTDILAKLEHPTC